MNSKRLKQILCIGAAGLMISGTAFAETAAQQAAAGYPGPGGETRSEAEWQMLRDNCLEWQEIGGLVEEYNPQVLESFAAYRRNKEMTMSAEEVTKDLNAQAAQMEEQAALYEMETGGQLTAASLRMQAAELRESAQKNTSDRETLWMEMQETLASQKKEARKLFVKYHEACLAVTENETRISRLNQDLGYVRTKKAAGKAGEEDVRRAQESVNTAVRNTALLESERDRIYRELIVSCGWTVDAQAQIGQLPGRESLMVSRQQQETDLAKALDLSFLLRTDRVRLENANRIYGDTSVTAAAEKTLTEDTGKVREAFLEAARGLNSAAAGLDSAGQELAQKQKALDLAEKQKMAGFISAETLNRKKEDVTEAQGRVSSALCSLIRARITYDSITEGAKS